MFASIVAALFSGIPVIFGLGTVAIIWAIVMVGPQVLYAIPLAFVATTNSEILLAIPMFVLMGNLLTFSGIGDEMFGAVHAWLAGVKGGLAMAVVVICCVFAAVTGLISASLLTMGLVALPAMLSRNYHKHIALGVLAAGSALAVLIPPSIPMILYASQTQVSIGALFAGGLFPGLLLATLYILYIGIRSALQPDLCPAIPKEARPTWTVKVAGLRTLLPAFLLILLVLGSIYAGVCTPTEAASAGACGALIVIILKRKFTWSNFRGAIYRTVQLTAFGIWILVAASSFNLVYNATGASNFLQEVIAGLPVNPWVVIIIFQLIIFFCGMIMDEWAMIILLTPIFVPIVVRLGFSPLWFGIVFITNIQMAYLTPPYGFALFLITSILPKGLTTTDLYRSIWPFVMLQALGLVLCMLFPQIAVWLPTHIIK